MEQYFNPTGWVAIFSGTESVTGRARDVEAWRESDGAALVVDTQKGCLRAVFDYEDFSHLEKANKIAAVLPGGGWGVFWRDEGEIDPVFVWLVSSNGRRIIPVTMDEAGEVNVANCNDGLVRPGGSDPEPDSD
ncbi:hypothetical protein [Nocardiopsis ganjiahuensis]|uniref:hypothetical protein n=1 Tax=Nocardiopsis ganjiahuensis TaxID=239984 RepID=UPI000A04DD71|nr:hypothetical protein [Nocardiopsis ganjiahuensis]